MGTKNNPSNRGKGAAGKSFNEKPVKPVLFIGTQVGKGKFIAAIYEDSGDVVTDNNGDAIPWDSI